MSQGDHLLPDADVDETFRQRPAYLAGCLTDEPDLSIYDDMLRGDEETNPPEIEDQNG